MKKMFHKSAAEWEGITLRNADWHLLRNEEITIVETMKSKIEEIIRDLLRNYILIMDCTALTKPATIAYYKLAVKYKIPLIYVYEGTGELTWIISREDLIDELHQEEVTSRKIDYQSTFENERMKHTLKELAIAGKPIGIRELARKSEIPPTTLLGILKDLEGKEITTREHGIELKYKTPLCYIFDSTRTPYAYLGLLGERKGRSEPETETALRLLKNKRFTFKRIKIVTTHI